MDPDIRLELDLKDWIWISRNGHDFDFQKLDLDVNNFDLDFEKWMRTWRVRSGFGELGLDFQILDPNWISISRIGPGFRELDLDFKCWIWIS